MRYLPLTDADRAEMLDTIGVDSVDALFEDVPQKVRLDGPVDLPLHKSEMEVERLLTKMSRKNVAASEAPFFVGRGHTSTTFPPAWII